MQTRRSLFGMVIGALAAPLALWRPKPKPDLERTAAILKEHYVPVIRDLLNSKESFMWIAPHGKVTGDDEIRLLVEDMAREFDFTWRSEQSGTIV